MERRLALAAAVSVALVVSAGTTAVAANLGILRSAADEPVGQLDAKSIADSSSGDAPAPVVVTVDEIVEVPVPGAGLIGGAAPVEDDEVEGYDDTAPGGDGLALPGAPSGSTRVAPSPSAVGRDDESEHESEHEEEHEEEEHEQEHEDDDD
jgi:hypothetical protein